MGWVYSEYIVGVLDVGCALEWDVGVLVCGVCVVWACFGVWVCFGEVCWIGVVGYGSWYGAGRVVIVGV